MVHHFEITLILRPEGTEEHVKQALARVEQVIRKEQGVITATESWGRRRLAFPLKKQREGVYYLLRVTAEPSAVDRFKRAFRLEDAIVRVMVIRTPTAEPPPPAPVTTHAAYD